MTPIDMFSGPNPPTMAAIVERFGAEWAGAKHRNLCVRLRDGRASVSVDGMPDYVMYYVPQNVTVDISETPGQIEIAERAESTPDKAWSPIPGAVCLGIAEP